MKQFSSGPLKLNTNGHCLGNKENTNNWSFPWNRRNMIKAFHKWGGVGCLDNSAVA